jgi:hypothetical protein
VDPDTRAKINRRTVGSDARPKSIGSAKRLDEVIGPMKTITIGTPYYDNLTQEYFESWYKTLISGIRFNLVQLQGTYIHAARNKMAMGITTDYILFIDSDMVWEPEDILKLLDADKEIIGGLYFLKKPPFHPIAYKDNEPVSDYPNEPFEVDSIGSGFLLIKNEVFQNLLDADFVNKHGLPFDPIHGKTSVYKTTGLAGIIDDCAFCARSKARGFDVWCHPALDGLGHIGTTIFRSKDMQEYWRKVAENRAG